MTDLTVAWAGAIPPVDMCELCEQLGWVISTRIESGQTKVLMTIYELPISLGLRDARLSTYVQSRWGRRPTVDGTCLDRAVPNGSKSSC